VKQAVGNKALLLNVPCCPALSIPLGGSGDYVHGTENAGAVFDVSTERGRVYINLKKL
jgi:hypothetical protein